MPNIAIITNIIGNTRIGKRGLPEVVRRRRSSGSVIADRVLRRAAAVTKGVG